MNNRFTRKCNKLRDHAIGLAVKRHTEKATFRYGLYQGKRRPEKYLVSVASFADRYDTLPLTLKSLLLQDVKPDKIVVFLDDVPITDTLEDMKQYGIEFVYTKDHLKPHKKYYYAMMQYPDYNLITVDDDLIYRKDMVGSLIWEHRRYPSCIIARRVHRITLKDGEVQKYQDWVYEDQQSFRASHKLLATGGAGTLYPAGCLTEETLNMEQIKALSPEADDLWLKVMELKSDVRVKWLPNDYVMPIEVNGSQEKNLQSTNVHEGKNDEALARLFEAYPEAKEKLL